MLIPHKPSRILKPLLTVLLGTLLSACNSFATPVQTGKKIMTDLTQTMYPICVGRLILEIPAVAKIENWSYEVDEIKINSITPPSLSQKAFDAKVNQLEAKLKTSPHNTEGVRFKSKTQLSPDRVLFVSRESKSDTTGYEVEALFWHPSVEYQFKDSTTNKYLEETTSIISKLIQSVVAMPTMDSTKAPPGFCLENGVLASTSTDYRSEDVAIKGGIDTYPGLEFKFSASSTNKKFDDRTLLERHESSYGLGDAMAQTMIGGTKYLRKGKRKLNGQSGEELAAVIKVDGETSMHANAEFYGEPNVLDKPMIRLSLDYDPSEENTQQITKKTLTEKEFLALWDALLNSIRPRTNSLRGDAGKK